MPFRGGTRVSVSRNGTESVPYRRLPISPIKTAGRIIIIRPPSDCHLLPPSEAKGTGPSFRPTFPLKSGSLSRKLDQSPVQSSTRVSSRAKVEAPPGWGIPLVDEGAIPAVTLCLLQSRPHAVEKRGLGVVGRASVTANSR